MPRVLRSCWPSFWQLLQMPVNSMWWPRIWYDVVVAAWEARSRITGTSMSSTRPQTEQRMW